MSVRDAASHGEATFDPGQHRLAVPGSAHTHTRAELKLSASDRSPPVIYSGDDSGSAWGGKVKKGQGSTQRGSFIKVTGTSKPYW